MENLKTMKLHLGANIGNLMTKIRGDVKRDMYMSSVTPVSANDAAMMIGDTNVIKVNGEYYLCGEGKVSANSIDRRPIETLHVLACFGAARQIVDKKANFTPKGKFRYNQCEIVVGLGLSINEFKIKSNVSMLRDNFDNKIFEVEYLNMKTTFIFNVASLMPEGFCHFQVNYDKYKKYEKIFFLDCGSKTWDMGVILNGKVREPKSEDYGSLNTIDGIVSVVNNNFAEDNVKTRVSAADIEKMIRLGSVKVGKKELLKKDFEFIIDKMAEDDLRQISSQYGSEIDNANLILAFGGGAYMVDKSLHKMFGESSDIIIVENAEYANAEAYYTATFAGEE